MCQNLTAALLEPFQINLANTQSQHLLRAAMAGKDGSGGALPGFPGAGGSGAPFDFSALQGILNVRVTSPVFRFCSDLLACSPRCFCSGF